MRSSWHMAGSIHMKPMKSPQDCAPAPPSVPSSGQTFYCTGSRASSACVCLLCLCQATVTLKTSSSSFSSACNMHCSLFRCLGGIGGMVFVWVNYEQRCFKISTEEFSAKHQFYIQVCLPSVLCIRLWTSGQPAHCKPPSSGVLAFTPFVFFQGFRQPLFYFELLFLTFPHCVKGKRNNTEL